MSKRALRVFVCSPLRGDGTPKSIGRNVALAKRLCRAVLLAGHAPFAPHVHYTSMLDEQIPAERDMGINAGFAWLTMADEIWMFARDIGECSPGMVKELNAARTMAMPPVVRWMPEEFEAERVALSEYSKAG